MSQTYRLNQIAKTLALPFVASCDYVQSNEVYHVGLTYDYSDILPANRNYLIIDATGFTADMVIDVFEAVIVEYYKQQYERAAGLATLARWHGQAPIDER